MTRVEQRLLVCLLVALSLAAVRAAAVPVDAGAPKAAETEDKKATAKPGDAAALVAKLGHQDWRVREQATRDLIVMGAAGREALKAALASPDAEVRWRASYVLSRVVNDLELPRVDPARALYASAAEARAQKDGAEAAQRLYAEVAERFPRTHWAAAARERLKVRAPEKAPAEREQTDAKEIALLVSRLGAPAWGDRQEASRRLAALGDAARPALERAAGAADPEIAWRAARLLERLAAADASAKAEGPPGHDPKVIIELFGHREAVRQEPGEANDLDALVRALGNDNAADVAHARELLLNLGQDATDALIRGLEDCGEVAGVEIMDLLTQITGRNLGFTPELWRAWWRALQERGKE